VTSRATATRGCLDLKRNTQCSAAHGHTGLAINGSLLNVDRQLTVGTDLDKGPLRLPGLTLTTTESFMASKATGPDSCVD
jgi:hypothetical protein